MRLAYYASASTAAAAACLLKAFHERPNFYSATVYLSQSNACLLIITNLLLICAGSFMFGLQRLLYGPLRPIEMEQLSEKAWYAVLDTLLAMPTYREDVGGWLLTMFVLLLAGKVWGWIGEGRVDILEQQPPANPRLFHARLSSSLIISVIFDFLMLQFCVESIVADPRPGIMVIFTFEFAILSICSLFTLSRYLLSVIEANMVMKQTQLAIEVRKSEIRAERASAAAAAAAPSENQSQEETQSSAVVDEDPIEVDENEVSVPGWEEKRRYLFGLELFTDFIKLSIYITFFIISITFNGLPMHILRDVYMTFASFSKRVADFIAYRKATSEMNTRYPDATTEEIREDSCIICREDMVAWEQPNIQAEAQPAGGQPQAAPAPARQRDEGLRAKKLPCGHILHLRCLKSWLERQQVCPTCRRPVVAAAVAPAAVGNPQPGQPAGQPGQPGQPPAPRAVRGRMFNLGPLRVALLNAPNEQMRNLLNNFENPGGAAADQNVQHGANHQVADPATPVAQLAVQHRRAAVPLNIQLMQVEQRLMQEAHNLGIEQQQLAQLRAMEAELSRLRAQLIPAQQPVGLNGAPLHGAAYMPDMIRGTGVPPPPLYPPPPQALTHQQLSGIPSQQYGAGHEHLPEGVTLPEGWSVMPLRRAGAIQDTGTQSVIPPSEVVAQNAIPNTGENSTRYDNENAGQQHTVLSSDAGPVDERGSPLFVATEAAPAAAGSHHVTANVATRAIPSQTLDSAASAEPVRSEPISDAPPAPSQIPAPAQGDAQAPWTAGNSSWGFEDQPSNRHEPEASTASEAQQERSSSQIQNAAREVQVEEVPDSGN